jgi:hypothetical protein
MEYKLGVSRCAKCGAESIGRVDNLPKDWVCHYCDGDELLDACEHAFWALLGHPEHKTAIEKLRRVIESKSKGQSHEKEKES